MRGTIWGTPSKLFGTEAEAAVEEVVNENVREDDVKEDKTEEYLREILSRRLYNIQIVESKYELGSCHYGLNVGYCCSKCNGFVYNTDRCNTNFQFCSQDPFGGPSKRLKSQDSHKWAWDVSISFTLGGSERCHLCGDEMDPRFYLWNCSQSYFRFVQKNSERGSVIGQNSFVLKDSSEDKILVASASFGDSWYLEEVRVSESEEEMLKFKAANDSDKVRAEAQLSEATSQVEETITESGEQCTDVMKKTIERSKRLSEIFRQRKNAEANEERLAAADAGSKLKLIGSEAKLKKIKSQIMEMKSLIQSSESRSERASSTTENNQDDIETIKLSEQKEKETGNLKENSTFLQVDLIIPTKTEESLAQNKTTLLKTVSEKSQSLRKNWIHIKPIKYKIINRGKMDQLIRQIQTHEAQVGLSTRDRELLCTKAREMEGYVSQLSQAIAGLQALATSSELLAVQRLEKYMQTELQKGDDAIGFCDSLVEDVENLGKALGN